MVSLIVAGATGAIGRAVVQCAIRQPSIDCVVALTRFTNTAASNFESLFGIIIAEEAGDTGSCSEDAHRKKRKGGVSGAGTVTATPAEAAKIKPITMDWEEFTQQWVAKRSRTSAAASGACNSAADPAASAVSDPTVRYRDIFSGHTYAAMCLGTTRKDAGSAKNFMRCDYDYVMAFTEAVLTYSAPAGLSPDKAFVHHIGDEGVSKQAHVQEGMDKEVGALADVNNNAAQSSGTLRAFCQVSASNASSNSWFLYMKTKGIADESTVERVHQHNKLAAAAAALTPVNLLLLQPGLLERHGKTRGTEQVAKLFMSSIPVETCGAAIVSACKSLPIEQAGQDEVEGAQVENRSIAAAAGVGKMPLARPYVAAKALRTAGMTSNEPLPYIYVANNVVIKNLASRLTA
ncbi:hypothetical protein, conserved [Leishmania tarentolae]|uniref:Uncharacterized protein n=1 Tax=Leishmania tarentolae TaxID=5689 RepID=A0A640KAQ0_LEITA|nr:hypothetical protein, conserved [Leishmania tarentolae]